MRMCVFLRIAQDERRTSARHSHTVSDYLSESFVLPIILPCLGDTVVGLNVANHKQ